MDKEKQSKCMVASLRRRKRIRHAIVANISDNPSSLIEEIAIRSRAWNGDKINSSMTEIGN